ncbi:MAG: hypothetical protein ACPGWR_17630 [Ardenticatenaceae bacterium]
MYLPSEEGESLIEYALILILIAVVVIAIAIVLEPEINQVMSTVKSFFSN